MIYTLIVWMNHKWQWTDFSGLWVDMIRMADDIEEQFDAPVHVVPSLSLLR